MGTVNQIIILLQQQKTNIHDLKVIISSLLNFLLESHTEIGEL